MTERDESEEPSAVELESTRVQAAVLYATPADLTRCSRDETRLCDIMRWWVDYESMTDDAKADAVFRHVSPIEHVSG